MKTLGKLINEADEVTSRVGSVTVRGWVVILLVVTTCAMSLFEIPIREPLYGLSMLAVGWYFGQSGKTKGQPMATA